MRGFTRNYYDGATTLGTVPGAGNQTKVEVALEAPGSVLRWSRTEATYDSHGRTLTSTAYTGAADTTGRTTTTAYTPSTGGPLMKIVVTNPLGHTTQTWVSRAKGTTTQVIDASGLQTNVGLDALGRVAWVKNPGQQGTTTSSATYAYTVAKSGTAQIAVTEQRLVNIQTSQSYVKTTTMMNSYGETVQSQTDSEIARDPTGAPTAPGRVVTATYYDDQGRVIKTHEPFHSSEAPNTSWVIKAEGDLNRYTRTYYDQVSRVTKVEWWKKGTLMSDERYAYGGDSVTHQPKQGGTTRTDFSDVRGNPTTVRLYTAKPTLSGNTVTGGTYRDTTYTHSPLGQMTGMTDAAGKDWSYTFDLAGRQVKAADPDSGTTYRTYLDTGELATTTDARWVTLTHTYDALGRKTSTSRGATTLSSWVYDTLKPGKLTSSTRHASDGAYTVAIKGYNAWGMPNGKATTIPAANTGLSGTYHTYWHWTTTGLMHAESYPAMGGMDAQYVWKSFTRLGNPRTLTSEVDLVTETFYDVLGPVNGIDFSSEHRSSWLRMERDAHTQRTIETSFETTAAVQQFARTSYEYNDIGDILKTVNTQGGQITSPVQTTCYRYNGLRELTAAWSSPNMAVNCATTTAPTPANTTMVGGAQPFSTTWAFDNVGSRTSQVQHKVTGGRTTTATTSYTMANPTSAHALSSTSTTTNPVTTTTTTGYTYDLNGNMLTRTGVAGGNQTFTYNQENRVASVANTAGTQTYVYDADGTLLRKKTPTHTIITIDDTEYIRHNTTGAYTSNRSFSHAGYPIATIDTNDLNRFQYTDQNNTASVAVAAPLAGFAAPVRRHMDPYGNPLGTPTGTWHNRLGFLGKHQDTTTGLTELGARLYDPTTGRFTQVDPIAEPLNPQQNNGYNYGWNNPISNPDPAGLNPMMLDHGGSYGRNLTPQQQLKVKVDQWSMMKGYGQPTVGNQPGVAASSNAGTPPWLSATLGAVSGVIAYAMCTSASLGVGAGACVAVGGAAGGVVSSAVSGGSVKDQAVAGLTGAALSWSGFKLMPPGAGPAAAGASGSIPATTPSFPFTGLRAAQISNPAVARGLSPAGHAFQKHTNPKRDNAGMWTNWQAEGGSDQWRNNASANNFIEDALASGQLQYRLESGRVRGVMQELDVWRMPSGNGIAFEKDGTFVGFRD